MFCNVGFRNEFRNHFYGFSREDLPSRRFIGQTHQNEHFFEGFRLFRWFSSWLYFFWRFTGSRRVYRFSAKLYWFSRSSNVSQIDNRVFTICRIFGVISAFGKICFQHFQKVNLSDQPGSDWAFRQENKTDFEA